LTTAAFKILRENVFTENSATIPIQISFNAQETKGVDADLQVQITSQWKLYANAIMQSAVLTQVPQTPSQVGNKPVGVPAHIVNAWSTYDFSIAGVPGFRVGTGLSYNDLTYGNTANTVWIPPSTVADAMFGYYAPHWDAEIGVKNITNVTYYTVAQSAGGFVGQPRSYYAKANWHF
jgi:iron complex outermembrane receptor protein